MSPTYSHKKIYSQIQGIQIIKVAAFSFAIISWIATATGLKNYVFDQYWQALLISFAIQSILFVFNLKLPFYFSKVKRKGLSTWLLRILIIIFYISLLFTSSWFSYVYISNTIYHKTAYIDANIELDSNYRKFLHSTEEYIDSYVSYLEENSISVNLASLKTELDSYVNTSEKSIEDLKYELERAKLELEAGEKELVNLTLLQETAEQIYMEPMTERWRSKTVREQEKLDFTNAMNMATEKQSDIMKVKQKVLDLENEINNFKESHENIIRDFMMEIAKDEPDVTVLNQYVIELHEQIIDNKDIPEGSGAYINIINSSQALLETIGKYTTLRLLKSNETSRYIKELTSNQTSIPDPDAKNGDSQIEKWNEYWKNNYSKLERSIKALPIFQKGSSEVSEPGPVLIEYDAQNISDRMDLLQRNYLAGINQMERAKNLLFGRFNFLAVVSLIFALFLDVSSLLAGLFIYIINIKKSEVGKKGFIMDASKSALAE
jgi:hypothetical protein